MIGREEGRATGSEGMLAQLDQSATWEEVEREIRQADVFPIGDSRADRREGVVLSPENTQHPVQTTVSPTPANSKMKLVITLGAT